MTSFAEQVQVHLAEGRQESVRVVLAHGPEPVVHLEPVVRDPVEGEHGGEDALVHVAQRVAVVGGDDGDRLGERPERPDRDPTGYRVGSEQAVRVVVVPAQDRLDRAVVRVIGRRWW